MTKEKEGRKEETNEQRHEGIKERTNERRKEEGKASRGGGNAS